MTSNPSNPLSVCGCCDVGLEEPAHVNRPGQSSLRYRIGVHASFLRRMLVQLSRQEVPSGKRPLADLSTRSTQDPAIAFLDAWATVADVLTFYQERIANEGFLRTATERRSVLELARAIGYELSPGVAASTYLAFTVDESDSTPDTATIKAGTQVQSIPAKEDELPQTFETGEEFQARVAWNKLVPKQTVHHAIVAGIRELYLKGANLQLEPGDALLILAPEQQATEPGIEFWDIRYLKTVAEFPQEGYTRVTWEEPLGLVRGGKTIVPPAVDAKAQVYVFRQRLALFGHNAPDWRLMPKEVRENYCGSSNSSCIEGAEWPNFALDSKSTQLHIHGDHPEILAPTWIALADDNYTELYRVTEAVPSSQTNFALTTKTTRVTLKSPENLDKFDRRTAVVLAVPERLERAEKPLPAKVKGHVIQLAKPVSGLRKGQPLIVSGKLREGDEEPVSEVAFFQPLLERESYDRLELKEDLAHEYVRSTVTIFANVVPATHGETVAQEVLGSGDGAQPNPRFTLRHAPLTFVPGASASGAESTLEVRVNDVLWQETPSLYGKGPRDRVYTLRIDDDAKATVIFGDGKSGARLPTGQENVKATYRFGIGSQGEVGAGSLTLLKKRPFGVSRVTNPVPATGAADPEKLENARQNAPLKVLTLDRIVSLQDFQDFARAFTGIGKAQAVSLWNGESYRVHITLADDDGDPVPAGTLVKLREAMDKARDPSVELLLDNYQRLTFHLEARVLYDPAYLPEKLQAAIQEALLDAFSFQARQFGQPVTAAEIVQTIHQVKGVVAVDLNALYTRSPQGLPIVVLRPPRLSLPLAGFLGIQPPSLGGDLEIALPGGVLPTPALGAPVLGTLAVPESDPEATADLGEASLSAVGGQTPAAVLPARTAHRDRSGAIQPGQLLLLEEEGIHLTLQPEPKE